MYVTLQGAIYCTTDASLYALNAHAELNMSPLKTKKPKDSTSPAQEMQSQIVLHNELFIRGR